MESRDTVRTLAGMSRGKLEPHGNEEQQHHPTSVCLFRAKWILRLSSACMIGRCSPKYLRIRTRRALWSGWKFSTTVIDVSFLVPPMNPYSNNLDRLTMSALQISALFRACHHGRTASLRSLTGTQSSRLERLRVRCHSTGHVDNDEIDHDVDDPQPPSRSDRVRDLADASELSRLQRPFANIVRRPVGLLLTIGTDEKTTGIVQSLRATLFDEIDLSVVTFNVLPTIKYSAANLELLARVASLLTNSLEQFPLGYGILDFRRAETSKLALIFSEPMPVLESLYNSFIKHRGGSVLKERRNPDGKAFTFMHKIPLGSASLGQDSWGKAKEIARTMPEGVRLGMGRSVSLYRLSEDSTSKLIFEMRFRSPGTSLGEGNSAGIRRVTYNIEAWMRDARE